MSVGLDFERSLFTRSVRSLVAIDEVGRGALAGPVTLGAVLVDLDTAEAPVGLDDSKKLSAKRRGQLVPQIRQWVKRYAIAHVDAPRIDEVGIMTALGEGAHRCIQEIGDIDDASVILLDGKYDFVTPVAPGYVVRTVVGGDGLCASIAAASVLAKEERDALMRTLHEQFPQYGWHGNVGYGSAAHREAIVEYGACDHHRKTWNLTGNAS